jgi:cytochrome c-type biogenesis protein CcmH/NrfG
MRRTLATLIVFAVAAPAWAEAPGNPNHLMTASRAALTPCVHDLRGPDCTAGLGRAEADAAEALALAPDGVEPRLGLALTLGMKAKRASAGEALARRYAPRGKALIDEALALDPRDARAYALLGGWNLEIVRRGGPVGARLMGASSKAGMRAFTEARTLAPNDPAIALHFAIALLGLNATRYGAKARELLTAASIGRANDAFDAAAVEEARRLGAVMAAHGPAAAATAAAQFL